MNARDIPEIPIGRKRRRKERPPETPEAKRARLLQQKNAMKALREAEQGIKDQTINNLDVTLEVLGQLLLSTAGESVSDIEVEVPATEGRKGKNKKMIQDTYVASAKLRIIAQKLLDKQLER